MKSLWLTIPAMVAAVVFHSCAPKPAGLLLDTTITDPRTVITTVRARQEKLQTVVGKGAITFESPDIAGTAAFELSLKRPDSLLVTFEGPFGIDLGMLFLSSGKYVVYNSMENRVVTGVPSNAAIRAVIPFDLTLDDVVSAFSGSFPLPKDDSTLAGYSVDDDMFLLSFKQGATQCRYWIDNRLLVVRKYEVRNDNNDIVMDGTASSFVDEGDISTPKRIRIRFPAQEKQLSVTYSTLSLDNPHPSFVYSIPPNARTTIR